MGISNAVPINDISRIVGYQITPGNFATVSPNLPQCIAILAEANDANQATLSLTPLLITSAKQAGDNYGYGSPIYNIARILFPIQSSGGGVQGTPVWVYPQAKAPGASNTVIEVYSAGTALRNGTHYLNIAGRESLDGTAYALNIVVGDNAGTIAQKITNAVANVLGCPMMANDNPYSCILTSKWSGLTSADLNITVDTGNDNLGLTYTVQPVSSGAGTPDVTAALNLFGNQWNTIVINSYGLVSATMNTLETFNGVPNTSTPSGRYAAIVFKPFVAYSGSNSNDPSTVTSLRPTQVTIAVCPCPNSPGLQMEAAANMVVLAANTYQNTPNLDVCGQYYPDMPVPPIATGIGNMALYTNRNAMVTAGCSTVNLKNGMYMVEDFVTTYAPQGENPPQFRYVRNIDIDWNVRYQYLLLELQNVKDHQIANDADVVTAPNVIKPKMWNSILSQLALDMVSNGLIVDANFMQQSITVGLSTTNPDRFETFFKYKRSGFARVISTTAQAGFNFGNV